PPVRVPRNERWATEAPEVNLQRTVESILSAVYQRVDSRTIFSSTTDVRHVLMCQGVEVECSTDVILHDVIPNAPFGALKFSSPYELARLLS
uniref:RNA-dependent RNA polymerase n=1 Tax=Haemonchus contortus TaxID=6289 RepID=A0A7I4XVT9_HAECO